MTGSEETENNTCMLYEAANQTPVYEVYQKLCKFRGNRDIDYVDFERKYYSFYHGNSAGSSSSKTFSDLPMDILKIVVDDLKLVDKLSLRKVSKDLRSVVDGQKFECSSVLIHFQADISQIELAMNDITYSDKNDKLLYQIVTRVLDSDGDLKMKYKDKPRAIEGTHWELMIRDLSTFLGNPNWKFIGALWDFDEGVDEDKLTSPEIRQKQIQLIENMMKKTPLQVKTMTIKSTEHAAVMAILPNVIPGSLEFLGLNSKNNGAKLEEIVELEQWKGLKKSYLQTVPDSFPIEHLFHLEVFKIMEIRISEERLAKIRDILFKSSKFSSCTLRSKIEDRVNVDENGEEITPLRAFVILINRVMGEHPEYSYGTRCYSIPNSDEHFTVDSCQRGDYLVLDIDREKNEREDIEDDSFEDDSMEDSLEEILGGDVGL